MNNNLIIYIRCKTTDEVELIKKAAAKDERSVNNWARIRLLQQAITEISKPQE